MYRTASRNLSARANLGSRGPEKDEKEKQQLRPSRKTLAVLNKKLVRGETIEGRFVSAVKGGFRVALREIPSCDGFCPHSQMYPRDLVKEPFANLLGKVLSFLIIEVKPSSVVLSRRRAAALEGWRLAEKAIAERRPIVGHVMSVQEYGVFVDIGGVDGLLHISQYEHSSKTRFNVGEKLTVAVSRLDTPNERISLSLAPQPARRSW